MKKTLLPFLRCPSCRQKFELEGAGDGGECWLQCSCSRYPIVGGIPRIFPNASGRKFVKGFSKQWSHFTHALAKEDFYKEFIRVLGLLG